MVNINKKLVSLNITPAAWIDLVHNSSLSAFVNMLPYCGDRINLKDARGLSALDYLVCEGRDLDKIQFLLKYNAEVSRESFFYAVSNFSFEFYRTMVGFFIRAGVKVNEIKELNGWTALHVSAFFGDPNMADYFVKQGSSQMIKDSLGFTPYSLAVKEENYEVAAYLSSSFLPLEEIKEGEYQQFYIESQKLMDMDYYGDLDIPKDQRSLMRTYLIRRHSHRMNTLL